MSLMIPRTLGDMYRGYSYDGRLSGGYGFFDGREDHARAQLRLRDSVSELCESRASRGQCSGMTSLELGDLRSIDVDWRDIGAYPLNQYLVLPAVDESLQMDALRDCEAELASQLRDMVALGSVGLEPTNVTYPAAKGKGAPFWFPGTDRASAFDLWNCARCGIPLEELSPGYDGIVMYIRVQGSAKLRMRYVYSANSPPIEVGLDRLPKVRKTMGYAFWKNIRLSVLSAAAARGMRGSTFTYRGNECKSLRVVDEVVRFCRDASMHGASMFAEDASAHDDHVGGPLLSAASSSFFTALPGLPAWSQAHPLFRSGSVGPVLEALTTEPLLFPPVTGDGRVVRVDRSRGLPSGSRMTTPLTTYIRSCSSLARLAASGVRGATSFTMGDDTLIVFKNRGDLHLYESKFGEVALNGFDGFKTEKEVDATYLKKNVILGCGYASRYAINLVNREYTHEQRSPALALVGLRGRAGTLKHHPDHQALLRVTRDASVTGPRLSACAGMALSMSEDAIIRAASSALERSAGASRLNTIGDLVKAYEQLEGGFAEKMKAWFSIVAIDAKAPSVADYDAYAAVTPPHRSKAAIIERTSKIKWEKAVRYQKGDEL